MKAYKNERSLTKLTDLSIHLWLKIIRIASAKELNLLITLMSLDKATYQYLSAALKEHQIKMTPFDGLKKIMACKSNLFLLDKSGHVWSHGIESSFFPDNLLDIAGSYGFFHYPERVFFLRKNGEVWHYGERGICSGIDPSISNPGLLTQIPLKNIVQVAAGSYHTLFLQKSGDVFSCGNGDNGQLGLSSSDTHSDFPVRLPSLKNIVQVAAAYHHSLFLDTHGDVWGCGSNYSGQLGMGDMEKSLQPIQLPLKNIQKIAAGYSHSLFLDKHGQVWVCGSDIHGKLGTEEINIREPLQLNLNNIIQIAAGKDHSLFLNKRGKVFVCGDNSSGQLGLNRLQQTVPFELPLNGIQEIYAGRTYSTFINQGDTLWFCGFFPRWNRVLLPSFSHSFEKLVEVNLYKQAENLARHCDLKTLVTLANDYQPCSRIAYAILLEKLSTVSLKEQRQYLRSIRAIPCYQEPALQLMQNLVLPYPERPIAEQMLLLFQQQLLEKVTKLSPQLISMHEFFTFIDTLLKIEKSQRFYRWDGNQLNMVGKEIWKKITEILETHLKVLFSETNMLITEKQSQLFSAFMHIGAEYMPEKENIVQPSLSIPLIASTPDVKNTEENPVDIFTAIGTYAWNFWNKDVKKSDCQSEITGRLNNPQK